MSPLALAALLQLVPLGSAQELVPGRVLEVELRAGDPRLEGHGPSRTFEYPATRHALLYVWAASEDVDPLLRVTKPTGETWAEDDDSGCGTTAFLVLEVQAGERPRIAAAAAEAQMSGALRLHIGELPAGGEGDLAPVRARIRDSNAARKSGDYAAARAQAAESVRLLLARAAAEQGPAWLQLLDSAALAAASAQDMRTTESAWKRVLEVRMTILPGGHPDLEAVRANLAMALRMNGDLQGARALLEQVLAEFAHAPPPDPLNLARARQALAATLSGLGDLAGALALEEQMLLEISGTLPDDHTDLQSLRANLAGTLIGLGDLTRARSLLEKVLEVRSRTLPDDHPDLQSARGNLALDLKALGDLQGARTLEEKVLEVRSRTLPDESHDMQAARGNLAATIRALGDPAAARDLLEKVLEVRLATLPEDHPDLQRTRQNLAGALCALGEVEEARALFESVLETGARTLPEDHPDLQFVRSNLAVTLGLLGDLPGAQALEEQVLALRARTLPDDHPNLQEARQGLVGTLAAQFASGSDAPGAEPGRQRCAELIGEVCRAQLRAAREAILSSAAREAEERCAHLAGSLGQSLSFALGYGSFGPMPALEPAAFALAETTRGAALASAGLARRAANAPQYAELRAALRASSAALADLARGGTTSEGFERARARRESVERELLTLARELAGGKPGTVEFDVGSLAARLGPREAAVGFRRFTKLRLEVRIESLCAFVVRSSKDGGQLTLVDLGALAPVEAAARGWREAIGVGLERGMAVGDSKADRARERGEALRQLVLDPLVPALGDAERVVVALDDVLHLVPLEALPLSADRLVGDRWRIETRATLTELLLDAPAPSGTALVALGGASFNVPAAELGREELAPVEKPAHPVAGPSSGTAWERGFTPLTHSGDEARGVGALYEEVYESGRPVQVLEKRKASRAALEALAPKARFMHIATHGWFAPESIRSWNDAEPLDKLSGLGSRASGADQVRGMSPMLMCGLALAGANLPEDALGRTAGLVTAEELSTLDLSNCELVVLSACDTNVGERRAGQGVASLQKALQMAGARSVITSLWRVPDEATKELMLDFYRRLWVEQKPKRQALWEAKTRLRSAKDERGKPLYTTRDWAAWVLTGDPH